MTLKSFFEENSRAAIGFSGGVDSVYLLYAAKQCGAHIKAYFVKTQFQPEFEYLDAKKAAAEIGAEFEVIDIDILSCGEISSNPSDRCYRCKRQIFGAVCERAAEDGFTLVLDGTNASDDAGSRPGMRAINELGVRSPLRECGLTKDNIRKLSKKASLFTWDKPSYSCLATRIPAGEIITPELLYKIEKGENALAQLGFEDFRLRYFRGAAGLQLRSRDLPKVFALRSEISARLSPYFDKVFVDLQTRD